MDSPSNTNPPQQAVRFSSVTQEIEPERSLQHIESLASVDRKERRDFSSAAQNELRENLSTQLQKQQSRLQTKRMENFTYEPFSLPASRVPSSDSTKTPASPRPSPLPSPRIPSLHSPPLTPSVSGNKEAKGSVSSDRLHPDVATVTPQISPSNDAARKSFEAPREENKPSAAARARASESRGIRPRSMIELSGAIESHPKQPPHLTLGPAGDSLPASPRNESPIGTPGSVTPPGGTTPGTSTPHSRPFTPVGERDDPYARGKRPPQPRNLEAIDPRFVFSSKDGRKGHYASSSSSTIPRSSTSSTDPKANENKRHSFFGGPRHEHLNDGGIGKHQHQGSMSELKRFFKLGGHKKDKRGQSPAPSAKSSRSGLRTPPSQSGSVSMPFADDHGLQSKYGKFGKVLGSGAGGSVRLMKRTSDGKTFAVKQFRDRHSYESEREYNKKVTAEFCIGSTLHHGNIIETMDIIHEKGKWYEVMEYAPFDLFAIVMTGKMSREEINCATLQILNGVTYIHSMGLAHRDLKLDNVVVNEHGIMKIIDFGSAAVFQYPFENDLVLASGIVGSDPYLAPEVYDLSKYDPRPTDIWSLAIIFCCMTLRRFPWKAPRLSDNSYKLFVSEPSDEERRSGSYPQKPQSEPASRLPSETSTGNHHHHHQGQSHDTRSEPRSRANGDGAAKSSASSTTSSQQPSSSQTVIKGPWRLLRLLPRETRHIIGRMLIVDPKKRATLDEILQDPWVQNCKVCQQEEGTDNVIKAEGHEHTLEPGNASQTPNTSRK